MNNIDKMIVRKLQNDIPLCSNPFTILSKEIGISERQLLKRIREMKKIGIIRRFGATLYHRRIGFKANAMVVWQVPKEQVEVVGKIMASFSEVSHCYQRSTCSKWPYNMFIMVHGKSSLECEKVVAKISAATGIKKYKLLYSTAELKKSSMKYFMEK